MISQVEQAQAQVAVFSLKDRSDVWNQHYDTLDNLVVNAKAVRTEINKKDWVAGLIEPGKKFASGVGLVDSMINNTKKFVDFFRRGAQKLLSGGKSEDDYDN